MSDIRPDVKNFALNDRKITRFLLDPSHKDNKGRAKFFTDFGFAADKPHILAQALLRQPRSAHTFRYQTGRVSELRLVYDGSIATPDGRGAHVRTLWNYDDAPTALFITVVPLKRLDR